MIRSLTGLTLLSSSNPPMETGSYINEIIDTGEREYVGGGELLRYLFNSNWDWKSIDKELMDNLMRIQVYKLLIVIALIFICIVLALKILGIRQITNDKGALAELNNISVLDKYEKKVLRYNRVMHRLVNIVDSLGFGVSENQREYLDYNLRRAGISIAGYGKVLTASEYNAILKIGAFVTTLFSIIVMATISLPGGMLFAILSIIGWSSIPMIYLRLSVSYKDSQIKSSFFDFYIKMHYALKVGGILRLAAKARLFAKTQADNPEVANFANNCADFWELYGEGDGSPYAAREYREIPEVGKLMRLIKQYTDGAEIQSDLEGFRKQLLIEKELNMTRKQEKLIAKCKSSSNILLIIFAQAMITTIAVYLPDLLGSASLFK